MFAVYSYYEKLNQSVKEGSNQASIYIQSPQFTPIHIPSFDEIIESKQADAVLLSIARLITQDEPSFTVINSWYAGYTLKDETGKVITTYAVDRKNDAGDTSHGEDVALEEGFYTLEYSGVFLGTYIGGMTDQTIRITYSISVVEKKAPTKKWTITDVIIRCLETVEPLFVTSATGLSAPTDTADAEQVKVQKVEIPRFIFDGVIYDENGIRQPTYTVGSQAETYDKVIAPEFAMTKSTLREQLEQIGGFIHAEPRVKYDNGKFKIVFDKYGDRKYSPIAKKKYISKTLKQSVNDYCTSLDSSVDNLVNRLSYAKGAVVEPYYMDGKSLRAETSSVRIDESSAIIPTTLPIDSITKLEVKAPLSAGSADTTGFQDITKFVFEKADYENMSSFTGTYPYSKAFAVYYTQGEKGVRGLFFKNPDAVSAAWFSKYAIINIFDSLKKTINTSGDYDYSAIDFRITYIPRYSARIRTAKQLVLPGLPSVIAYNQGANLVETRYYGENLKGAIARLGNVEKSFTYKVGYLTDIPKAGQLFDDRHYISAVSWEVLPDYFKVTIGLSKDFNRLSEYVGISSVNRMYQVSEKQAQARDSVFSEYLLITETSSEASDDNTLGTEYIFKVLKKWFNYESFEFNPRPQLLEVWGLTKLGQRVRDYNTILPVCASAMGSSIAFSASFQDNYSAGQKATKQIINDIPTYWNDFVPYNDYYGRFYYLNFVLSMFKKGDLAPSTDRMLPQAPIFAYPTDEDEKQRFPIATTQTDTADNPVVYRKESTEIPSLTYQLSFVTDSEKIVIGSGFARNIPLISVYEYEKADGSTLFMPAVAKLFILDKPISLFAEKIDVLWSAGIRLEPAASGKQCSFIPATATKNGKAWAIVTQPKTVESKVVDEDGNETTQSEEQGCDLIFGKNINITEGDSISLPRIVIKRRIN